MKYLKLFGSKTPALIISAGEYCTMYFTDGTSMMAGYTQKEIGRRYGVKLKMVRRGVYVDPEKSEITEKGVKIMNREYNFSRRIAKLWAIIAIAMFCVDSYSQNIAPIAVNDTLRLCNDIPSSFTVILNDTDANGDRLKLNYFSEPISGNLVSESNTGRFRYEFFPGVNNLTFQYNIKDLRFGNIGSLTSNMATVVLNGSAPYFYTGTYSGNNTRESCRSINTTSVNISGTTREKNEAFQHIILDARYGTVTISPDVGGSVELKIK